MRNYLILALAAIAILTFSNCEKEDLLPVDKGPLFLEGKWQHRSIPGQTCHYGGIVCTEMLRLFDYADSLSIDIDPGHVYGSGSASSNGDRTTLDFEFTKNNLSPEETNLLLSEQVLPIEEEFEFEPELVQAMYEQAGLTYDNVPVIIGAGTYPVKVTTDPNGEVPNPENMVIKVKISREKNLKADVQISVE